jgi:acyl-coenzyme A thioesterase PaaI-like protein
MHQQSANIPASHDEPDQQRFNLIPTKADDKPGAESTNRSSLNTNCFVCGEDNINGLHLEFSATDQGSAAQWIPKKGWESYQEIIHGGVISTVLDEAMAKAILFLQQQAFTVDLRVRFHQSVKIGEPLLVRGWIQTIQKRRISAEASIATPEGVLKAHAWGTFLIPRK